MLSFHVILLLFHFLCYVYAQATTMTVPPLQWLNLTSLLSGSSVPPPLKNAAIGYDETSRSVIVFGGESAGGFPQSSTYLLNLDTLQWSSPNPPDNLRQSPEARSACIAGSDDAASYRRGFVVVGGQGTDGGALSDIWEYDFNNEFWAEVNISPGGPSARWGSSGGIDIREATIQDPLLTGPNNSFYLAGGYDGETLSPLSDLWRLNISGTLSSNLPDSADGSWEKLTFGTTLPGKVDVASTVISQQVIDAGGCNTTSDSDESCAQQDSYVIDTQSLSVIAPGVCAAPRFGGALVPNMNTASSSFATQVFLMLGTLNTSLWDDGGGLEKGEVDVLDIGGGTWSRILPAGDPGTSGSPSYPGPREGASAVTYTSALVGGSRSASTDTLVFGGQDDSGNYLSEVWILRAYSGTVDSSDDKWSGYGDGQLDTGVNATGAGVQIQYLTTCASAISSSSSGSSSTATSSSSRSASTSSATSPSASSDSSNLIVYDVSLSHKILSTLSVVTILPSVLLYRYCAVSVSAKEFVIGEYFAAAGMIISYSLGIAGFATSFSSISSSSAISRRSPSSNVILRTNHGRAGLAFAIAFYFFLPAVLILRFVFARSTLSFLPHSAISEKLDQSNPLNLPVEVEQHDLRQRQESTQSAESASIPSSPRPRTHSWGPSSMFRMSEEERRSTDSESAVSNGPRRTFEVLNRPRRTKDQTPPRRNTVPGYLSQLDWLQRRRSLNAVGELDYAITQSMRLQQTSTPNTADVLVNKLPVSPGFKMPSLWDTVLHVFFHILVVSLCVISLVALWTKASRATFGVFLAWTVSFYVLLLILSWHGRPQNSLLTVVLFRLRGEPLHAISTPPTPIPGDEQQYPFPTTNPYSHHQPAFRAANETTSASHEGARGVEIDDENDDVDDDTRQRRMEEEMDRRDVSIVTVPKRKLWITNPS